MARGPGASTPLARSTARCRRPRRLAAAVLVVGLWLVFAVLGASARAATAAFSAEDGDSIDLTTATEWCETTPETDAATVATGGCTFAAATPRTLARGFSRSAFWLRLRLVGAEPVPTRRLLAIGNGRLEHVAFHELGPAGPRALGVAGLAVAPSRRLLSTEEPILPLTLAAGESRTLLVRVASRSAINLEPIAWRESAWMVDHERFVFVLTLANGGLIATGLFAAMIGLGPSISQWSRRANLLFAAASFSKAFFNLANAAFLPGRLLPADIAYDIRVQGLALALSFVSSVLFLRHFLETRRRRPRLETVFRLLLAAMAADMGWMLAVDYGTGFQAAIVTSVAMVVVATAAATRAAHAGMPGAWPLAAAWWVFLATVLHRVARTFVGGAFDETFIVVYSLATLSTAPLIPIGIALNEGAIRRELDKARAEVEARVDFLARMSHELRSPLDTILGNAQLIARHSGEPRTRNRIGLVLDSGRHLLRMIDDILDHARGLAGRLTLAPVPVVLADFLEAFRARGDALAERSRDGFTLRRTGGNAAVLEFDEDRLRQVLDNLVANAARHTRDGRIDVLLDVAEAAADGTVRLDFTVADSGEGIAAADLDRIFRPFERGAAAGRGDGKGLGMGLTIARQIVELMGGRLTVESRPGEGATFRFSVATRRVEPATAASPLSVEPLGCVGAQRTVLLVDDRVENRAILATLLREAGFDVVEAGGGRAAIAVLDRGLLPDLVITDQFMADGDGWTVLRAVAATRPDLPVLSISAAPLSRPTDVPATVDFAGHFLRPLDHGVVIARIVEVLGLAPAVTAAPASSPEGSVRSGRDPIEVAPASIVAARPAAARLAELAALVEDGRVSEIIAWAVTLRSAEPRLSAYADAVAALARDLDFAALRTAAVDPTGSEGGEEASTGPVDPSNHSRS